MNEEMQHFLFDWRIDIERSQMKEASDRLRKGRPTKCVFDRLVLLWTYISAVQQCHTHKNAGEMLLLIPSHNPSSLSLALSSSDRNQFTEPIISFTSLQCTLLGYPSAHRHVSLWSWMFIVSLDARNTYILSIALFPSHCFHHTDTDKDTHIHIDSPTKLYQLRSSWTSFMYLPAVVCCIIGANAEAEAINVTNRTIADFIMVENIYTVFDFYREIVLSSWYYCLLLSFDMS